MKDYKIEYSCGCTMGMVRKNNEDNYCCDSKIRLDLQSCDDVFFDGCISSKDNDTFAVFDGMGGEACGEIASFVAANNCADFLKDKQSYKEYIYELSTILNQRIKEETNARSLVIMGSTAAMIQFYKTEIYILNVGDSRIYKLTGDKLSLISKDHVIEGFKGKSPLTNFLGMPNDSFDPYIAKGSYKADDIFILCTDGITDMLDESVIKETITQMLKNNSSLIDINRHLIELAKQNGGIDNATLILCKICK